MIITDRAYECIGLLFSIGRVLNVVHVDEDRRMWLDFELTDAFLVGSHERMVITLPDTDLDYCDTRQCWAERERRRLYEGAL